MEEGGEEQRRMPILKFSHFHPSVMTTLRMGENELKDTSIFGKRKLEHHHCKTLHCNITNLTLLDLSRTINMSVYEINLDPFKDEIVLAFITICLTKKLQNAF
jgi:polynucleotide 5'-kinase involved in rRNA processing